MAHFQTYRGSHRIQCTNFHTDHQILIIILIDTNVKCLYNVNLPIVQLLSLKNPAQKVRYISIHTYIYVFISNTKNFSSPIHCFMHHILWNRITPLKISVITRASAWLYQVATMIFFLLLYFNDYATRILLNIPILKFQSTEQILIYVCSTKKQADILHTWKSKKGEVLCLKALGRNE